MYLGPRPRMPPQRGIVSLRTCNILVTIVSHPIEFKVLGDLPRTVSCAFGRSLPN